MPKFLITVLILSLLSLASLGWVVSFVSPYQSGSQELRPESLILLGGAVFLSLTFGVGLASFWVGWLLFGRFSDARQRMRGYLGQSAVLSLGVTVLGAMRLTHTLNGVTLVLLLLSVVSLLISRRR